MTQVYLRKRNQFSTWEYALPFSCCWARHGCWYLSPHQKVRCLVSQNSQHGSTIFRHFPGTMRKRSCSMAPEMSLLSNFIHSFCFWRSIDLSLIDGESSSPSSPIPGLVVKFGLLFLERTRSKGDEAGSKCC